MPSTRIIELRHRLAMIFEDEEPRSTLTRVVNLALALLIIVNVAAVVLESVDAIRRELATTFMWLEHIATAIFVLEYGLRVWACVDFHHVSYPHPLWGRLRYMRSFFALVDLISVLPAILGILGAGDLRVLRLLRLLRMLKLVRHSTVFGLLWAVLKEEAQSILALLFILLLTVTIAGVLMYMIEGEVQPEVFTSIPVAMWWAIETLTTVGYGDIVPVTPVGRILGGVVSIVGIGTLALFSGLITVGFLDQLKTYRVQHAPAGQGNGTTRALSQQVARVGSGASRSVEREPAQAGPELLASRVCPRCGFPAPHPTAH